MSRQKRNIIAVVLCLITLAIAIGVFFITNKESPKRDNESEIVSSDVSSNINIEDIENDEQNIEDNTSSTKSEIDFLEPDETKADKVLEENKSNKNNTSTSTPKEPIKDGSSKSQTSKPVSQSSNKQSFEEGKNELESEASKYLKDHNIDPKTAGETGEKCKHCGKKIWNPDKYGFFIPGMPEDYENSDYCLGTCGIYFE